ncbi:hypothetical protein ACN28I_37850 [Archangium gephyra]|uniref:hypothetical protein n=1 Tax=Archangium gephyra TaxID=48 RepID=UPI003B7C0E27
MTASFRPLRPNSSLEVVQPGVGQDAEERERRAPAHADLEQPDTKALPTRAQQPAAQGPSVRTRVAGQLLEEGPRDRQAPRHALEELVPIEPRIQGGRVSFTQCGLHLPGQ